MPVRAFADIAKYGQLASHGHVMPFALPQDRNWIRALMKDGKFHKAPMHR
ncbi:MAG: hypothetical protein R3D32_13025 [Nitratireductor sp.]